MIQCRLVVPEEAELGTASAEAAAEPDVVVVESAKAVEEVIKQDTVAQEDLADAKAVDKVEADPSIESGATGALRIPSSSSLSNGKSGYVELTPVSFEFGGNGAAISGAKQFASGWDFTGRAAKVEKYSEAMLGVRKSFSPNMLKGGLVQMLAGVEYGNFELPANLSFDESGVVLGGALGYNFGRKANLSAGLHYSSFFEGDPSAFGQFLYRFAKNLDLSSRVEGGDNANVRFGLRLHY